MGKLSLVVGVVTLCLALFIPGSDGCRCRYRSFHQHHCDAEYGKCTSLLYCEFVTVPHAQILRSPDMACCTFYLHFYPLSRFRRRRRLCRCRTQPFGYNTNMVQQFSYFIQTFNPSSNFFYPRSRS